MELTVRLPTEALERLNALAEIAGVSPEEYARQLLTDSWADADAALAHYDRTGEYVSAEEAVAKFAHDVEQGLASRGRKSA